VKRSLAREAQKIKNSGGDSAQAKRALQKIKYVMRKADEKISHLGNEERKKAGIPGYGPEAGAPAVAEIPAGAETSAAGATGASIDILA